MKILCDTTLYNRYNATSNGMRAQKATIAIGLHPPNKENSELFLLHFTPTNKTGTRYKLKTNIEKVFAKFCAEGKTTISFKEPPHDLQIKCDPVQLKCFLQTLKLAMTGQYDRQKLCLSSIAATAIPSTAHPTTKLVIRSRGEFPLKGLPRTLTSLHVRIVLVTHKLLMIIWTIQFSFQNRQINGIRRCRVDSQIFFLKNLRTLNLSDNCIERIPKQMGELQLVDVDFSKNQLNLAVTIKDWDWLDGQPLQQSLQCLNLSENTVKEITTER